MRLFSVGRSAVCEPPLTRDSTAVGRSTAPAGHVPRLDMSIARGALRLTLDVPIFAALGPLDREGGPDRLWRAWAAVRRRSTEAELLVLADGPVPVLPGIRALGAAIPNLAAHLDACDALMVLARRPGLPEPAADAQARGVPLIVSREAAGDTAASPAPADWLVDGDHAAEVAEALLARSVGTVQWFRAATGIGPGPSGRAG